MRKVIIDCDPGHDDALAILIAAKHLDVLGITTVGGNASIENVTRNALCVVELGGLDRIPVARGMAQPLVSAVHHAKSVHGESGLDGHSFPAPTTPLHAKDGVAFIIDTVMATEGITLVPTGPLTNVATALRLEPRIRQRIVEISLMGGSATWGNANAVAEFNVWCDPEAAHVTFTSGIPIRMAGLNLTWQTGAGELETRQIRQLGNPVAAAVANLLEFYRAAVHQASGAAGAALHDICAVVPLIDGRIIDYRPMHVAIELRGEHTRGMTVCDYRQSPPAAPANVQVGMNLDRDAFYALLYSTLASYTRS